MKQYIGTLYVYILRDKEKALCSQMVFLVPGDNSYVEEAKGGDSHDLQWLPNSHS